MKGGRGIGQAKEEAKEARPPPPPRVEDKAVEAELKAAKERASVPLEERTAKFKEMLTEKEVPPLFPLPLLRPVLVGDGGVQVSAFSTWEKELHKIVFDPRYLLLSSKERKATFDEYVKERAEVGGLAAFAATNLALSSFARSMKPLANDQ